MNTSIRPGFAARASLVLLGIFCAFLVFAFISGLSKPQEHSLLERVGNLILVLTPSVFGFKYLLRRELSRTRNAAEQSRRVTEVRKRQEAFVADLKRRAFAEPIPAVVQGGSGTGVAPGEVVLLSCRESELALSSPVSQTELTLPFIHLRKIEIVGPGAVTTNAGVIGGGFGVEGALKGMLVASLINTMTSKTTTNTFVRIASKGSEIHLHVTTRDLRQLRLDLSPAFVAIESAL